MNIETIRYFEEVARAESFYGAAKRLAVSQQGLNKAITSLERELSTKLLERSRKGVTLTPTGSFSMRSTTPTRSINEKRTPSISTSRITRRK